MTTAKSDPWPKEHEARLNRMAGMEKGWDSYRADPPSAVAIANAREFVRSAVKAGLPPDKVNPSAMGGVGVTFRRRKNDDEMVFVEFYNPGHAHALFAVGGVEHMHTQPVPTTPDGYRYLLSLVDFFFKVVP